MPEEQRKSADDGAPVRRLWWLIAGRFVAAVLFLLASALWTRESFGGLDKSVLYDTLPIFIVAVALSLLYAVALFFSRRWRWHASGQLFADVLIVTWLVWVTGDVLSPYAATYIIIIAVASIFLGPRGALVTSAGCAVAFTAITLLTLTGIVPHYIHG